MGVNEMTIASVPTSSRPLNGRIITRPIVRISPDDGRLSRPPTRVARGGTAWVAERREAPGTRADLLRLRRPGCPNRGHPRYHPEWLQNLLISASLGGYRSAPRNE